ncbi:MAG: hypothetical protein AAFY60_16920, partial [Myxococcota bacterium]
LDFVDSCPSSMAVTGAGDLVVTSEGDGFCLSTCPNNFFGAHTYVKGASGIWIDRGNAPQIGTVSGAGNLVMGLASDGIYRLDSAGWVREMQTDGLENVYVIDSCNALAVGSNGRLFRR